MIGGRDVVMLRCLGALAIASCAYHPDTFRDRTGTWPGIRQATACLDISIARRDRDDDAVVAYHVGNRCDYRVTVDLGSVRAVGRDREGHETAIAAYDPRRELRPLELAARWSGGANIAYRSPTPLDSLCVDVGGIEREHAGAERWVCLGRVP